MNNLPRSIGDTIHDECTAFAFERDQSFRNRDSDSFEYAHPPFRRKVRRIYDDDDPDAYYDFSDSRALTLTGEYAFSHIEKASLQERKIVFNLGLTAITYIDTLPRTLLRYFTDEQIALYRNPATSPGILNEERSLIYTIRHNPLDYDRVAISHRESYRLFDHDVILHTADYPPSAQQIERIPVASEQRTLHVKPRIHEEASTEPHEQVIFDSEFNTLINEESFELYDAHQADAARTIRALMKVLRSSRPIPTFENLHTTIDLLAEE